MPRIKRWFPVSHDINRDPDIRVMIHQCGERSLRVWLEILSIADRNDGLVPGESEGLVTALGGASEASPRTVRATLDYGRSHLWLVSDPCLRVAKYAKYHRTEEQIKIPAGNLPGPSPTRPSEPLKIKDTAKPVDKSKKPSDALWKEIADRIYGSDPQRFGRLITFIKRAEADRYPQEVIAEALKLLWEQIEKGNVDGQWWGYATKLLQKSFGRYQEQKSEQEKQRDKEFLRKVVKSVERTMGK